MSTIDPKKVQELREKTGAGMMDCKKALIESQGDFEKAIELLRLKGAATAEKKAGRSMKDGCISHYISPDNKTGILFEFNCETDFVACTDQFQSLMKDLTQNAITGKFTSADQFPKEKITDLIAKLGENMSVGSYYRFEVTGTGMVSVYMHPSPKSGIYKLGVLLQVETQKVETLQNEGFKAVIRDIAMQIAAQKPEFISHEEIPTDVVDKEIEIYKKQAQQDGKPEKILDKIAQGKLAKYFEMVCLYDQLFIKDDKIKVGKMLEDKSKELDDTIKIVKFGRIKIGESK